ncbi:MAG: 30S ribosomal protein S9 [Schleiferiaceae bacterium]|nr:30S ribosomal protein S9 [Schleiferiaceae bacterium]
MATTHTLGRRKKSVARVFLQEGKGQIEINNKPYQEYFSTKTLHYKVQQAFLLTETENQYDVKINVQGGGITGQAEAIRLGLSRALCEVNPEHRLKLKPEGMLMRDPRAVERKKYGLKKARKKDQFSKR